MRNIVIDRLFNPQGHRIENIPEVPLVVSDKIESYTKTKEAVILLRRLKAWSDIEQVRKKSLSRLFKLNFPLLANDELTSVRVYEPSDRTPRSPEK